MNTPYPHPLKNFTSRTIPLALTALAASPLSVQAASGFIEQGGVSSSCNLSIYREAADWSLRDAAANAAAVSADGHVTVGAICDRDSSSGRMSNKAVLWTEDGKQLQLSPDFSMASGVSADGSTVVGWKSSADIDGDRTRAFRWTAAGGLETLAGTPADSHSFAHAVSGDGSVVVGALASPSRLHTQAFRWNSAGRTMQTLESINASGLRSRPDMPPGSFVSSLATGVSDDGRVVVGSTVTDLNGALNPHMFSGTRAFRWTERDGFAPLTPSPIDDHLYRSWASATNADGSVIVGFHSGLKSDHDGELLYSKHMAFRWTEAEGTVSLGYLPSAALVPWIRDNSWSKATDVSGDGQVVVGHVTVGDPTIEQSHAFRWTRESGMQTIEAWLAEAGVDVASDWLTYAANGTNADGSVVVGQLLNGNAFIARVNTEANASLGSGMIDVADFQRTLTTSAYPQLLANTQAGLVLHGAHSDPLRMLPKSGRQDVWVTGDWGRQAHEGNQGTFGTGEVGVAHGLSDALMLKLAVGRSNSQSSTLYNGSTRITGTYVVPELIAAIPGTDLYASVSGYYSSGEAEINRGYLNAGTPEIGRGTPDTQVSALRLRLDWRNALTLGDTAFTPYSSYTQARSRVDGYSEASGNFPVRWDSRDERTSLIHTGVDARHHLNDRLDLIARLEGVHRMEDASSGSSGQILGLNAFELQGVSYKQDWWRSGFGVEGQLGPGIATLMLNASSEGDSPSTWGFASYRLPF
jgi:uncharacterized membrane protein